jgi:hypothetical protein
MVLSQLQIAVDPTIYQTYVQGEMVKTSMNRAAKKIPFVAGAVLEPSIGNFGDITTYYDKNNKSWLRRTWDSFFSPAITGEYNPTPNEEMLLDLYESTGETKHIPKDIKQYQNINIGEEEPVIIKLSPKEYRVLSQFVGKRVDELYNEFRIDSNQFTDNEKIEWLNGLKSTVSAELRYKLKIMYDMKQFDNM